MQGTTAPGLGANRLAGRGFTAGGAEMRSEQRTQLLDAVMVEFSEHGYEEMSVARALAAAGVSAAEFQAEFADLDECLFAGYEQLTDRLTEATKRACEAGYEWPQRVRLGLQALLSGEPADPRKLRPDLVEFALVPFLGAEAANAHAKALD
jgi:AcrR family transcriptional regulator